MKRVIGLVFICGAASCVSASAATSTTAPPRHSAVSARGAVKTVASRQPTILELAPADEYFGPLKLSILGIRNTIHDLGARYDVNHDIGHQTFTSAQLTERAIHDWEGRYPRDGQVPKAIYLLQRLYTKVLTQEARDRASSTAKWMFADYAASPQGRQLKKMLAVEHLAPVIAPAPPAAATPVPAYPSDFGSNYKSDFGSSPAATVPASSGAAGGTAPVSPAAPAPSAAPFTPGTPAGSGTN